MRYIQTYTSEAIRVRPANEHGLRCAFRRLVNTGVMLNRDYEHFIYLVERYGSIENALRYLWGECDSAIRSLRKAV
jgi:hypothetical protein